MLRKNPVGCFAPRAGVSSAATGLIFGSLNDFSLVVLEAGCCIVFNISMNRRFCAEPQIT